MNHLDAMLKDENQAARLLAEVHGDVLNAEVLERASAYEDPLLAYIKQEIIIPFGRLEAVEDSLFARIEQFVQNAGSHQADELINRAVASENPMLPGAVERLEQRIMERIDQEQFQKRVRVVWPVFSTLFSLRTARTAAIAAVALFALTGAYIGWTALSDSPLNTLITQAYGTAYRDDLLVSVNNGSTIACKNDGSLTLVNKAGSVAIHDAIALTLDKASKQTVKYRVSASSPAEKSSSAGSIEFSVAKRSRRQRFVVETPYFDIHVIGTRFVVAQEKSSAFRTTVSEGTVRISSRLFSDTVLTAGQTLTFVPGLNEMRIATGRAASGKDGAGEIVSENAQGRVLIKSDPVRAAVFINKKAAGITPFAAVLPSGTYAISVRSRGRRPVDTLVELNAVPFDLRCTLYPMFRGSAPRGVALDTRTVTPTPAVLEIDTNRAPDEAAKQALADAQRFESTNWKKALGQYKLLAHSMETPPLYRETALFSVSRLTADKLRDTAAAMNNFSRYLILYPKGMFAGEALLRLSELELTRSPASAVDYFRKFLTTSPDHPRRADVAYHMGLLLQQQNEYAEAIRMFNIALIETKATRIDRQRDITRMIVEAESLIEASSPKPASLNP
jgi:hypothetical protein